MAAENEALLATLRVARERLERQIDLTLTGKPYWGANREVQVAGILATLRGQLREIDEIIGDIEAA